MRPLPFLVLVGVLLAAAVSAAPPFDRLPTAGLDGCSECRLLDAERNQVTDNVAHYRWTIQVGPDPLDRIRLHRVVIERSPYKWPQKTPHAVMLVHGSRTGFEGTFLTRASFDGDGDLDPKGDLATALARKGIDVWGIDLRWTLVPSDTADLSPLAEWGMAQDARDVRRALVLARFGRWLTGGGRGKIDLLGYSWGGRVGYAYLDAETEQPKGRRHVDRYIALEGLYKTADAERRATACLRAEALQAQIDAGVVAQDNAPIAMVGALALNLPDGLSPILPPFTNRQVALIFGSQRTAAGLVPLHGFAGLFDNDLPITYRFTDETPAFGFFAAASGLQPLAGIRDLMIVLCDDGTSTLDDRLGDVEVPVLYLGAAGGFATEGLATFPFLGSLVLESTIVSLEPPGYEVVDVGHADIVQMRDLDIDVLPVLVDWIKAP